MRGGREPNTRRVPLDEVAVIVPVAAAETAWRQLLPDLRPLPPTAEVILVGTQGQPADWDEVLARAGMACPVRWLQTTPGRAKQLNYGAASTSRGTLWFVHADSRITPVAFDALGEVLSRATDAIYYFQLAFQSDGPAMTRLNAYGANLRSRWLRLPFGDQGLCIAREQFNRLGGFDEHAGYGEDHLLIWSAHRLGIAVRPAGATISSSARNYRQQGWLRATVKNVRRTVWQAVPQWVSLLAERLRSLLHIGVPNRCRLIVFARCPDPGQCKTRLIPALGIDGATALYEALLAHTTDWVSELVKHTDVDVEVQFSGTRVGCLKSVFGRRSTVIRFRPQTSGDLGNRLALAFETAFRDCYSRVAVVGTDCPGLNTATVQEALHWLERYDLVLGPAADGGYYLIALRRPVPELFSGIAWGESAVLDQTVRRARVCGVTIGLLPVLEDIDRPSDLANWQNALANVALSGAPPGI